jgi:hypothetical protein
MWGMKGHIVQRLSDHVTGAKMVRMLAENKKEESEGSSNGKASLSDSLWCRQVVRGLIGITFFF